MNKLIPIITGIGLMVAASRAISSTPRSTPRITLEDVPNYSNALDDLDDALYGDYDTAPVTDFNEIFGYDDMNQKPTRGERNNNPGNIEKGQRWLGLAPIQLDTRFATFISPEYGIRAIKKVLQSYNRRGLNTIRKIFNVYAPPFENPTELYISNMSNWTGFNADEILDVNDSATLEKLVTGIIRKENGRVIYASKTIIDGVALI